MRRGRGHGTGDLPRARCPVCRGNIRVTTDGVLFAHKATDVRRMVAVICPGSGKVGSADGD